MTDNIKTSLTIDDINAVIVNENYIVSDQATICELVLKNGAKVIGINYGAIDPTRHSAERGKEEAKKQALEKVWELEGYLLRQKLQVMRVVKLPMSTSHLAAMVLEAHNSKGSHMTGTSNWAAHIGRTVALALHNRTLSQEIKSV